MNYRENLGYVYPERSDEHMIDVPHLRDTNFDENYKYIDKSWWKRFKKGVLNVLLNTIVFLVVNIRHGLKIYGKENFKKHKKLYKDGAITICNHVFYWDYLCVLQVIKPVMPHLIAWKTNFEGPNGGIIDWVGGVPVPTDNFRAMAKFQKAIDEALENKEWLHVFPEGSMWFYYPDIRPLKPAAFKFAYKHNKPIIPMAISFRKRKGITRLFSKKPLVNLHVGEPILPDLTLDKKESIDKMHKEAYRVMQELVGIKPGDPTYNEDQNIENYRKTM